MFKAYHYTKLFFLRATSAKKKCLELSIWNGELRSAFLSSIFAHTLTSDKSFSATFDTISTLLDIFCIYYRPNPATANPPIFNLVKEMYVQILFYNIRGMFILNVQIDLKRVLIRKKCIQGGYLDSNIFSFLENEAMELWWL